MRHDLLWTITAEDQDVCILKKPSHIFRFVRDKDLNTPVYRMTVITEQGKEPQIYMSVVTHEEILALKFWSYKQKEMSLAEVLTPENVQKALDRKWAV